MMSSKKNKGMSLVEILIAVAVSFMVLAALFKIFLSSKENLLLQDNLARMQENARVAIQALEEDIRMAGFMGEIQEYWNIDFATTQTVPNAIGNECFNDTGGSGFRWVAPFVSVGDNPPAIPPKLYGQDDGRSSFSGCIPSASYRANTDVLSVHYAGPANANDGSLSNNTYYIRSNLYNGSVFRSDGGTPPSLISSGPYTLNFPITARTYYVSADNNSPALMRVELSSSGAVVTNPVAEGVVSMQVRYGVDTDATSDGIANRYEDAGSAVLGDFRSSGRWPAWADVKTVRIWLLLRSQEKFAGFTDPVGSYTLADQNVAVQAGYRYQLFVTTIAVRNASGDEP